MREENLEPRPRGFLAASLWVGAAAGCVCALLGAMQAAGGGIFNLNERAAFAAAAGGPLVGLGCGYAVWMFHPRRGHWLGCLGWAFLQAINVATGGTLAWVVFYVATRMMSA